MSWQHIAVGMAIAASLAVVVEWAPWRSIAPAWLTATHLLVAAMVAGVTIATGRIVEVWLVVGIVIITVVLNARLRRIVALDAAARARKIREEERETS